MSATPVRSYPYQSPVPSLRAARLPEPRRRRAQDSSKLQATDYQLSLGDRKRWRQTSVVRVVHPHGTRHCCPGSDSDSDSGGPPMAAAICAVTAAALLAGSVSPVYAQEAQPHALSIDRGALEAMIERKFAKKLRALPDDDLLQMVLQMLELEDDSLAIDTRSLLGSQSRLEIIRAPPVRSQEPLPYSSQGSRDLTDGEQKDRDTSGLQLPWEEPPSNGLMLPWEKESAGAEPGKADDQQASVPKISQGTDVDSAGQGTAPEAGSSPSGKPLQPYLPDGIASSIGSALSGAVRVAGETVQWAKGNINTSALPVPPARVLEVTAKVAVPVTAAVLIVPWLARSVAARFGSTEASPEPPEPAQGQPPDMPRPPAAPAQPSPGLAGLEEAGSPVLWEKSGDSLTPPTAEPSAEGGILWSRDEDPWFSDTAAPRAAGDDTQKDGAILWRREPDGTAATEAPDAEARQVRALRAAHRSSGPGQDGNGTTLLDNVET